MKLDRLFKDTSAIGKGVWIQALPILRDVEGILGADERLNRENIDMFEGLCDLDEDPNEIVHEIDDLLTDIDNVNSTHVPYPTQKKEKKRVSPRN